MFGADDQDRTGDLSLTKTVRYRLCHISDLFGAGEEIRTPDILLGKQTFYP